MSELWEIKTRVAFRIDTSWVADNEVVAILVDSCEPRGELTCYTHIGQHSTCDLDWVRQATRPATDDEARRLLVELQGQGYEIEVVR